MLVVRMRRGVDRGHYCVEDSGTHGTDLFSGGQC